MKRMLAVLLLLVLTASAALAETYAVGQTVYFGRYEQDNNPDNGPEPIEWTVISLIDLTAAGKGKSALLISRYILDCRPYGCDPNRVTWHTSGLRKWLNGEFRDAAFTPEELEQISVVAFTPHKKAPSEDRDDWLYVLGKHEAEKFFPTDAERAATLTPWAEAQGAIKAWWLYSPNDILTDAHIVGAKGNLWRATGSYVNESTIGVRPCLRLKMDD